MNRTRVKMCGITSPEDASAAAEAGADAVGMVFADSPRQVDLARAREVVSVLPPFVSRVGVFVDAPPEVVDDAAALLRLDSVQFHGSETPERCADSPVPVVKAFRVREGFDVAELSPYEGRVSAILLDTYSEEEGGGTGRRFSWDAVGALPDWVTLIVAGGLDPTNVGYAIETFHPFGVDVSTGVEQWPGHKDKHQMRAFVAAVHAADEAVMA